MLISIFHTPLWQLWGFMIAMVALQPHFSLGQANSTSPADVTALVDFMAGLSSIGDTQMVSWDVYTDPCTGVGWPGVICHCSGLPSVVQPGCSDDTGGISRIRGIDLHLMSSSMQRIEGTISPALGDLTQLVYLDLSQNHLSGTLPQSLGNLMQLQWLLLADNQLTGSLPAHLGQLPKLRSVQLQNNRFSESVPSSWCNSNASYDISGNIMLCGVLPRCFWGNDRLVSTSGTFLTTALGLGSSGGACDATPPDCDADVGCVIWTPKFWTNTSFIQFNFTGFVDYQSGVSKYEWGLGTQPYAIDVMPLAKVTSSKVLKDIKYSGSSRKMFVTVVYHTLPSLALVDGLAYYITVVAYNGAGPSLTTNSSSAAVIVDTSGPVPSGVYNTFEHRQDVITYQLDHLQASWDDWTDPESGMAGFIVQFYQLVKTGANNTREVRNITDVIAVGLVNTVQMRSALLQDGMVYYANVTGTNRAGLQTSVLTLPITVKKAPLTTVLPGTVALIAALCGVGCLAIGAGAQYAIMNIRIATEAQREKERQQEQKQLKQLMYALSAHTDSLGGQGINGSVTAATKSVDIHAKELAFVFTDIENSTEISNQDPAAFKQIQEAHDQVMREGIAKHRGYEVITEGDSFQVAFATCQAAIQFSLDVQYRLLEQSWSKEILKLHACRVQRATGDYQQIVFAGPRVRMGIHYAHPGTVAMRTHNITRQNVYGGPAIKIGSEVSDIAAGGQILLTEEAVMKLAESMSQAGFPVIKLCGQYKLETTTTPVFLYSCSEQVGKPLQRTFGDLRKAKKVWPNAEIQVPPVLEYNIHVPPVPDAKTNALTFVCLRLTTYPRGGCNIPEHVQRRFLEVFAVQVQQFKGYMFQASPDSLREGIWTAAFSSCMDALRFTHAAQLLLMHTQWPADARAFCGEALPGGDGRWVFQGPRVCMAIHESSEYFVSEDSSMGARTVMIFAGPAVTLPLVLTYAGRGGQVILSETAWESVKSTVVHHPGAVRIISLGTHIVSADFPQPMLLMEVMPNLLSKRVFQSLLTKQLVEPGYRDAPDPKNPMAIVFVKVSKPKEVEEAEKGTSNLDDTDVKLLVQENQVALGVLGATVRKLLKLYEGYECKEPEPGKFTLAFHKLEDAICWGCHFQEELLFVNWPATLLERCAECKPQLDTTTGLPIWRGLRVKVGMSFGMVNSKKPLNTGRADYYGVLANGAARVMGLAAPGQVLVEAMTSPAYAHPATQKQELLLRPDQLTHLLMKRHVSSSLALSAISPQQDAAVKASMTQGEEGNLDGWECHIQADGYYMLRGLSNARLIYKAYSGRTGDRGVKITSQERLAPPPMGMYQSFVSSRDSVKAFGTWIHSFRAKHLASRGTPDSGDSPLRIAASLGLGRQQHSFAAGTAASVDSGSPGVARSEPSGVASRISSSRLSTGVPRARSQEFGPGWRGGSATSAGHMSAGSLTDMHEASLHSRRSRSWVTPVQRYHSASSSQQPRSFTMQGQGHGPSRMFGSGLVPHAAAGNFRQQQQQQQQQQADGTVRHASAPGSMSDLYWIPARLAPIHTRTSPPDADSRSAASGTSVTTTPTQGSPSPDPADATTSMEHKQRIYLKHQAQRVVQQHSIAADGSVTPHYFEPGEPSLSISGSLPPTGAVDAEQLRSHSQLLLEQQRLLQNMQQMVHDREGGDQSARSSWDGLKGYMTNIAGAVDHCKPGRFGFRSLLSRLSGRRTTGGMQAQEDMQGALARQQLGMQGNALSNLPSPGRASSPDMNALSAGPPSPGTAFAVELGQAYVNHKRLSMSSGQAYSALYEARAASFNTGTSPCSGQHVDENSSYALDEQPGSFVLSPASYSPQHFQQPVGLGTAWQQPGASQLCAASYSYGQAAEGVSASRVSPAAAMQISAPEIAAVDETAVALQLNSGPAAPVPVPAPAVLANRCTVEEALKVIEQDPVRDAASLQEDMSCGPDGPPDGWWAQQQQQLLAGSNCGSPSQGYPTELPQLSRSPTAAGVGTGAFGPPLLMKQAAAPLTAAVQAAVGSSATSGAPFMLQDNQAGTCVDVQTLPVTTVQELAAASEMTSGAHLLLVSAQETAQHESSALQEQLQQAKQNGSMVLTSQEYGMYVRQQQQQSGQVQRQSLIVDGMLSGFDSTAAAGIGEPMQRVHDEVQQQQTWQLEAVSQPGMTQQSMLADPNSFNSLQQRLRHQQTQMTPQQLQQALQQLDRQQLQPDTRCQSQITTRSPLGIRSSHNRFCDTPTQQAVNRPGSAPLGRRPWQEKESRPGSPYANAAVATQVMDHSLQQGTLSEEGPQQLRTRSAASVAAGSLPSTPRAGRADGSFASAGNNVVGYALASPGDYSPTSSVGTPRSGGVTPRSVLSKSSLPGTRGSSMISVAPGDLRHSSFAAAAASPPGSPRYGDNSSNSSSTPFPNLGAPISSATVQVLQGSMPMSRPDSHAAQNAYCQQRLGLTAEQQYAQHESSRAASDDEQSAGIYVGPPGMPIAQLQQSLAAAGPPVGSRCRSPASALSLIPESLAWEGRQSDLNDELQ